MRDILYVVNMEDNVLVATIERTKESMYVYTPCNLDYTETLRPLDSYESETLPPMASRRLFPKSRPDIKFLLSHWDMEEYDEWELLKRTKGKLLTDSMLYLTEEEYRKLEEVDSSKYENDEQAATKEMALF